MLYDDRDRIGVRNVVAAGTVLAWICVIAAPYATSTHVHDSGTNGLLVASRAAVNWLLMLAAMMAPLLIQPIQFIRAQGLERRSTRATLVFVASYSALWMVAGVGLLSIAAAVHSAGLAPVIPVAAVLAFATVWQCSPAKQVCLNRCHVRPALPAFGWRADAHVVIFGATHAGWCIGSCAAWMLVPLLLPGGHMAAMMTTAVLIYCERLATPARPAWQVRGVGKAWRVVSRHVRQAASLYFSL